MVTVEKTLLPVLSAMVASNRTFLRERCSNIQSQEVIYQIKMSKHKSNTRDKDTASNPALQTPNKPTPDTSPAPHAQITLPSHPHPTRQRHPDVTNSNLNLPSHLTSHISNLHFQATRVSSDIRGPISIARIARILNEAVDHWFAHR